MGPQLVLLALSALFTIFVHLAHANCCASVSASPSTTAQAFCRVLLYLLFEECVGLRLLDNMGERIP